MSKIIDVLNRRFRTRKEIKDPIQEELVRTFFSHPSKNEKKNKKPSKTPWIITALALFCALFIIFNRVSINLEIKPALPTIIGSSLSAGFSKDQILFLKDGNLNNRIVKDIYFSGDAVKFSRETNDMLILVNSKGIGWANVTIELKEPLNIRRKEISYTARGQSGGEYLTVILIDEENKMYRIPRDFFTPLKDKWETYTVSLKEVKSLAGITSIERVKFEFGTITAGNNYSDTIFIKDISLKKEGA